MAHVKIRSSRSHRKVKKKNHIYREKEKSPLYKTIFAENNMAI